MAAGAVAAAGVAGAVGALGMLGAAGAAGALPMRAGEMDLPPPPMRLAYASEGAASEATVRAITVAEVRKEVFTEFPEVKMDRSGWAGCLDMGARITWLNFCLSRISH